MTGERVERLRRNHRDEIDSAALYDAMASAEREQRLAGVYRDLAAAERRHAARWADQLEQLGDGRPAERPSRRARVARLAGVPLRRVAAAPHARRARAARPRALRHPAGGARRVPRRRARARAAARGPARARSCEPGRRGARAHGAPARRRRRQRLARGGTRGQRRPRVEPQPRDGRRRRRAGRPHDPRHRHRRAARRRAVDGDGRVDLGAELARALRAPDRGRAARDRHDAGARDRGARADLPRQGRPDRARPTRWPSGSCATRTPRST